MITLNNKQRRINAGNNFIYFTSRIKQLQKEVQSLKDDWLMCDEVCDQKELKIRELNDILNKIRTKFSITDLQEFKDDPGLPFTLATIPTQRRKNNDNR